MSWRQQPREQQQQQPVEAVHHHQMAEEDQEEDGQEEDGQEEEEAMEVAKTGAMMAMTGSGAATLEVVLRYKGTAKKVGYSKSSRPLIRCAAKASLVACLARVVEPVLLALIHHLANLTREIP